MIICFYLSGGSPSLHSVCLSFHIRVCAGALVGGYICPCMYVRAKPRRLYVYMYVRARRVQRKTPVFVPWTPFVYLDFWTVSHFLLDLTGLAGWLGSEPQESQLPPPQCWGHKHMSPQLVFWGLGFASRFPPALPLLSSLKPPLAHLPFVFLLSPVPLLPSCFPH